MFLVQLGYDVSNFVSTLVCTYGYVFKVVSNSHSVDHITTALFDFVCSEMITLIQGMPTTELLTHTQALLDKYTFPSMDLHDEALHYWSEVECERYSFKVSEEKASLLHSLVTGGVSECGSKLLAFCERYFVNECSRRVLVTTAGHPVSE